MLLEKNSHECRIILSENTSNYKTKIACLWIILGKLYGQRTYLRRCAINTQTKLLCAGRNYMDFLWYNFLVIFVILYYIGKALELHGLSPEGRSD